MATTPKTSQSSKNKANMWNGASSNAKAKNAQKSAQSKTQTSQAKAKSTSAKTSASKPAAKSASAKPAAKTASKSTGTSSSKSKSPASKASKPAMKAAPKTTKPAAKASSSKPAAKTAQKSTGTSGSKSKTTASAKSKSGSKSIQAKPQKGKNMKTEFAQDMKKMTDKDIISDVLKTQKSLVKLYGTALCETSCDKMRNLVNTKMSECAKDQYDAFLYMNQRNLYPTENAPATKLDQAKKKFDKVEQQMKSKQ